MKLVEREWNEYLNKYENVWLANDETGINKDFDCDSAEGSIIMVISNKSVWIKNADCKWQKCGTTEVCV